MITQHYHKSVTPERIMSLIEQDNYLGLCVRCGYEQDQCEPDCRRRTCEQCGSKSVYGAEELLIMGGFGL